MAEIEERGRHGSAIPDAKGIDCRYQRPNCRKVSPKSPPFILGINSNFTPETQRHKRQLNPEREKKDNNTFHNDEAFERFEMGGQKGHRAGLEESKVTAAYDTVKHSAFFFQRHLSGPHAH